jgi:hypothetical protein
MILFLVIKQNSKFLFINKNLSNIAKNYYYLFKKEKIDIFYQR